MCYNNTVNNNFGSQMKYLTVVLVSIALSGCAAPLQMLANSYNHADPCQARAELNRPQGYQRPSWCGASGNRATVYDVNGRVTGYIKP